MAQRIIIFVSIILLVILTSYAGLAETISPAAAMPHYRIVPGESVVTFNAKQNHTPVTGNFKIDGSIIFDPNRLDTSKIDIFVPIDTMQVDFEDVKAMLVQSEWLNQESFPIAQFHSKTIEQISNEEFKASGDLEIRGQVTPVEFTFVLDKYSPEETVAHAAFSINRLDFDIGQGPWQETDTVEDEVALLVVIRANR